MGRMSKDLYYLGIAKVVAARGTCLRRNFGVVIVKNDQIIATGYTGAPRGTINCVDIGKCYRDEVGTLPGERYELCRSVHAEVNAILHAGRDKTLDAIMYIVGLDAKTKNLIPFDQPCRMCRRLLINAGVKKVVIQDSELQVHEKYVREWVEENLGELVKDENGDLKFMVIGGY